MMQIPLVSIITVVRNDVSHIEETMLSVLNQTYQNIEYIVIDGGSTDGTVEIIKKYAHRLAYWVSESDGGIYPAMNKGLEHASGEWVNFMNSGDTFVADVTIEMVFAQVGDCTNLKIIGGGTINVFNDHSKTFLDPAKSPNAIPVEIPFSHQACFVRRDVCKYDPHYKIAADYKVMYDVFFEYGADSIASLDIPIANYAKDDSFSTLNLYKSKGEYLRIQSAHRSWHWWKEYLKWRLFNNDFK